MKPVLTKKDYFKRWVEGEFGNRLRAWNSLEDLYKSRYKGPVSIRFAQACVYDVQHYVPAPEVAQRIRSKGWDVSMCRFNESPNDDKLLIQGELVEGPSGWYFLYSTEKMPMRKALEYFPRMAQGLRARAIIQHFCCPSSFADLEALLELYPDHVIEFSVFGYNLGDVPHRNTVVWEVRKY